MIKEMLHQAWADIVAIQESKTEKVMEGCVRSFVGVEGRIGYPFLKRVAGGMVIVWIKEVVELILCSSRRRSITATFKSVHDNFEWYLIGVYDPCRLLILE